MNMLVSVHPIQLFGPWDIGYALDKHMVYSTYIGDDPYDGHPCYDSQRSEIGELLYQFKYQGGKGNLFSIVDTIVDFMNRHHDMQGFDTIIPVPPTPANYRTYQPTLEIAKTLAKVTRMYCCENVLEKTTNQQLKNMSLDEKRSIERLIVKRKNALRENNVLLIDDLYDTGITLSHCVSALRDDPLVRRIGVLTITKTKGQ